MKKIWVILLATMMALAVCLTASVADEATVDPLTSLLPFIIGDGNSYTFEKTDNSSYAVKKGDTVVAKLADNNGAFVLENQSDTLTVKTKGDSDRVATVYLKNGGSLEYDEKNNTLTISGDADWVDINQDITLILDNATIGPASVAKAGILVEAKTTANVVLKNTNSVTGGEGHAGIEIQWLSGMDTNYGHLSIDGTGKLIATGGSGSGGAGIGGSKEEKGVYGDVIINGGVIEATGTGRAAGIGSSDNPADGTSRGSYKYVEDDWGTITINGGRITAKGVGNGAGIGGGNHTSSGPIIINGGTIDAYGDSGIGSGLGSSEPTAKIDKGVYKGPGYYFADVTINGGNITAYATNNMGAGIGGGMYCDAYITINGGTVNASVDQSGKAYQGGAGIGGGYQGAAIVNITGGEVYATGGHGAPGIGNGALASKQTTKEYQSGSATGTKNIRTGKPTIGLGEASVNITGGYVEANGGKYGAGIGTGNASEQCNVSISGGQVVARGYKSTPEAMNGAAGIGSGVTVAPEKLAYEKSTNVRISITAGNVLAVGGWGAAGIGSGAKNKTANTINISGGQIEAYADGTKFAIDTRNLHADGSTSSITAGRNITRNIVQGTFVHNYEDGGISQRPEGLKSIFVAKENENPDAVEPLTGMPEGYRSFATSVDGAGTYTVYTDSASIGEGGGRYFAEATNEKYNDSKLGDDILFDSNNGKLSDNFYLFPVKTIVVSKEVDAEEGADRSGINEEFSFALWSQAENGYVGGRKTISIVNGVPQNKAYFVNIPDGQYDITEMNGDTPMREGSMFSGLELRRIGTRHGAGTDNDGVLSPDQWSDAVTVINTFGPLSGVKTWNDANNQDGIRPAFITVNLLADGAVVQKTRVTPDASGAWRYSFENLPGRNGGNPITYTVSEEPVAGYTAEASGMNLINTHIPETVNITGVKTWNDADNQDGIRPAFITVNLLADGAVVQKTRVTPDASGVWRYSFENLPGRSGGNPITYTVSEEPVAGYTAEASGTNLINTHVPETIDITGVKIWNDADNQDGIRPANIRVNLLANGTQIRTATVTGTTNRWNFTFEDLPRFEGGVEIAYTVTEAPVAGYTTAINGTTITNTHVPEVVTISGTKTWNDDNNEDGIRPDSITVNLLADGRKIDSRTVLGGGSYTFENLNRYERGREIRYTIEEEPVAGYTAEVSGYNLINTHVPERVEISGTKTWADHDNRDGLRPQSVTVNLMADGTQAASQTVTGEGNVWSFSFTNLPGYRNGRKIVYTVTENPVAEYETSIIGTNIYNIHQSQDAEPERYTVTIRYWADGAKAFPDYNGTYNFCEEYDVTSPAKPGYTVDKALVAGIVYENTVIDVYYTPNTVKLSVFYQYLDGSTAADPHFETLHAGDRYSVVSPAIEGYTASIAVVEGTMPGQDLQVIVWYRPDTAEENEGRVPLGDGTTMITEYGVPLGLGDTNRNAGECYD